jgi:hypothetical protein
MRRLAAVTTKSTEDRIARAIGKGIDADFANVVGNVQGAISLGQADLLRKVAASVREGVIIEVGSFRGKSTAALSIGSKEGHNAPVYAIDPHEDFQGPFGGVFGPPDRREFFLNMLTVGGWENVRLVNLSSEVIAPGWNKPVGMLWIDGDHSYEGVRRDFECWLPHLVPGAPVILDDTDRGGPKQFIEELLAEGWKVTHRIGKMRAIARDAGSPDG